MRKKHMKQILAALLAALTLLSLAACGNTTAESDIPDDPAVQEQTDHQKKDNTAKSGNKTDDTRKDDTASGGTTTDKKGEKTDAASSEKEPDKTAEEPGVIENDQKGTTTSDSKDTGSGNTGTPATPTPPTQPETPSTPSGSSCTISISCSTILNNMDMCRESKKGYVPSSGTILSTTTVAFEEGETVYDVLQRVCRDKGIQMDASWTAAYNSAYVKGIGNLYEFDVGEGSGWMYKVNGWFPNYGCSSYDLQDGDTICWVYTCDLGDDVGGGYMG